DFVGVVVAGGVVVDGDDAGLFLADLGGDGVAQVFAERGDAALAREIASDDGGGLNVGGAMDSGGHGDDYSGLRERDAAALAEAAALRWSAAVLAALARSSASLLAV